MVQSVSAFTVNAYEQGRQLTSRHLNPRSATAGKQGSHEFTLTRKRQTPPPAFLLPPHEHGVPVAPLDIISQYPSLCISLITDKVKYFLLVYYAFAYLILQSTTLPWPQVRLTELCSVPLSHQHKLLLRGSVMHVPLGSLLSTPHLPRALFQLYAPCLGPQNSLVTFGHDTPLLSLGNFSPCQPSLL